MIEPLKQSQQVSICFKMVLTPIKGMERKEKKTQLSMIILVHPSAIFYKSALQDIGQHSRTRPALTIHAVISIPKIYP